MHIGFLLTGSNVGDRLKHLETAVKLLEERCGRITMFSTVFETAAWGKEDQRSFLNQALCIETALEAKDLLREILDIELSMGRVRGEKYGERKIDIDILFYDDVVLDEPGLHVPHPFLQDRRFALVCMNDIAPDKLHPVFFKTISELLEECEDPLPVHKFS
jgi:2-amino-4-hydroxy-6-hydroxymethyldihydropteridine diphosphokinase